MAGLQLPALDQRRGLAAHGRAPVAAAVAESSRVAASASPKAPNKKTRVAAQAKGGEVLVSSVLKSLVESAGDLSFGDPREVELKGLSGSHTLYPLAHAVGDSQWPPSTSP